MKKILIILLSLWLFAAANSAAMSLGRHRGAALIGRPLDISVPVVLDAQEDAANVCVEADIYYADNKLDKSRVRVTVDKALPTGPDALIRIRSSALVDEPVVTVSLRVGCQQKFERRYVVLADLVSEVASLPAGLVAIPQPGAIGGINSGTAGRASSSRSGTPAVAPGVNGRIKEAAPPSRRKEQRSRAAEKTGARLKLEPLDLTVERDPQLKSSAELLSSLAHNEQERSAAAALWRALSAQPQDILRDFEKLQLLENSVRSLQAQAKKNLLTIDELNGRVNKAKAEKYANVLVYVLAGLLLLVSASLAFIWRRRTVARERGEGESPWYRKSKPLEKGWNDKSFDSDSPVSPVNLDVPKWRLQKDQKPAPQSRDRNLGRIDPHLPAVRQSGQSVLRSTFAPRHRENSDFSVSMPAMPRAVKAEELLDVQQQADFFVSLGQHDQAIEVLRSHIGDNVETSALVYLDLFSIYHRLKRQSDYEALRIEFNEQFNGQIPAFEFYTYTGPGLASHPFALSRIQALWHSPKVLEVIEESIFKRPGADAEAFDLESYRELLLLYAVAKELASTEVLPPDGMKNFDVTPAEEEEEVFDFRALKFRTTAIQPLSAGMDIGKGAPLVTAVLTPDPSALLSLDLDLSEPPSISEGSSSSVESDSNFFAQFDNTAPIGLPVIVATPGSPAQPSLDVDNLIDFDPYDAGVKR